MLAVVKYVLGNVKYLNKMKTTDLIYQNQKVLNALQEMLLQTKKHVEFLAANAPEIRISKPFANVTPQTCISV